MQAASLRVRPLVAFRLRSQAVGKAFGDPADNSGKSLAANSVRQDSANIFRLFQFLLGKARGRDLRLLPGESRLGGGLAGRRLIDQFEARAPGCRDAAALQRLIEDAARELGFAFFALLHHASLELPGRGLVRIDTYPEGWADELVGEQLVGSDPVHHACRRTNIGFAWEQLPHFTPVGNAEREVLARARRFGIGDGFTVPINIPGEPPGSCTFAVRCGTDLPRERLLNAEQLGAHAFHAARRLAGFPMRGACPRLSRRERQCLRLLAAGKTDWEIGTILGVSPETVRQYLKHARAAYGVASRAQLVACGLRDALVRFEDAIPPNRGMD